MGITSVMAHVYAHEDTEKLQREAIIFEAKGATVRTSLASNGCVEELEQNCAPARHPVKA
jgi:hypothetical protein